MFYSYRIPRSSLYEFKASAKFRNTLFACGGDRNFEDFAILVGRRWNPTAIDAQGISEMAECLLQLIDDALSNQEIADTFVLPIGTVRYYAGQIYDKLQVISQTQAVVQVREKGILQ